MNVKFITATKDSLNTIPVVDGQLVFVSDKNGCYYDMNSIRRTISGNNVIEKLPRRGIEGEIYVVVDGDDSGLYTWDDSVSDFVLIANINTDRFTTYQETSELEKVYLVGLDEGLNEDESDVLHYNTNFYLDTKTQTLHVTNLDGKASDAAEAEHAKNADKAKNADNAKKSDEAAKMSADAGANNKPVYILEGVPTAIDYEINASVPEDALFTDTTYSDFLGATEEDDGASGLVPQPSTDNREQFLKGDGTWSDVVIPDMVGVTKNSETDGVSGLVPAPHEHDYDKFLKSDGTWGSYSQGAGISITDVSIGLEKSGVTAGTYGSATKVPQLQVDKYGRVISAKNVEMLVDSSGSSSSTFDPSTMEFSVGLDGHLYLEYEEQEEA